MKEWRVLPTDPRFQDMTDEQWELLYNHYLLDNPPKSAVHDPEYDKEDKAEESYHDPDFADEWNQMGEEGFEPMGNVGKNLVSQPTQDETSPEIEASNSDISDWEEV